ncbi:MAG: hypothetical protein FXV80_05075 [Candidatus Thioglobus sp.]|nr:MAG: hypothetical protein FXV80_05075 [Candidatus Thioglobus sp.]
MKEVVLERALNFLLQDGKFDVRPLDGKTLHFSMLDFPLDANFICTNNRIFVSKDAPQNIDVDIKLKASVFLALLQGGDLTELLRQDEIIINGDVKSAQLLVDLLQQVPLDLEELLSVWIGDIGAHQLVKLARKLKATERPISAIKDKISNFLIAPSRHS